MRRTRWSNGGVERSIGTLARVDIAGDQVPRRLCRRRHSFQLWQVGTVVLAMAALHHPLVGHLMIAIARRAIQANPCQREFVHGHRRRPQGAFDRVPRLVITQTIQDAPQAIIAALHLTDRVAQQVCQGVRYAVRPGPHSRLAVIGLRQDVGQPAHGQLPIVQPLLQTVCPHMVVKDLSHMELVGQANDQGNIVDSFVSENKCLCHGAQPTAEFAIGPINSRESAVVWVTLVFSSESVSPKVRRSSPISCFVAWASAFVPLQSTTKSSAYLT